MPSAKAEIEEKDRMVYIVKASIATLITTAAIFKRVLSWAIKTQECKFVLDSAIAEAPFIASQMARTAKCLDLTST